MLTDSERIAFINISTWRTTYRGIFPDEILDGMKEEKYIEKWNRIIFLQQENDDATTFVCEVDGHLVGYGCGMKLGNEKYDSELTALYILKEFQRQHIGKELVQRIVHFLKDRGAQSMIIWMAKGNPAEHFYSKLGGKPLEHRIDEMAGSEYEDIGFVYDDLSVFE